MLSTTMFTFSSDGVVGVVPLSMTAGDSLNVNNPP